MLLQINRVSLKHNALPTIINVNNPPHAIKIRRSIVKHAGMLSIYLN